MKYLIAIFSLWVLPAVAADITGDWKVEGDIGTAHVSRVCTLKQNGDKLAGACKNDEGEVKLTGSVNGETVTWEYTVTFQGRTFPMRYKGTVESAEKMKGKMEIPGEMMVTAGEFTATKQK